MGSGNGNISLSLELCRGLKNRSISNCQRAKAGSEMASRSLNVLKIDSPLHSKCRELLIVAD